jgi:DNA-binding GntR family transcriptional regulator
MEVTLMPVPVVAEPISRVPTRETVASTLRSWIVNGTLVPEEVLRDADIAQAFGISRTPVREALLQLEHEGLVESQPGRWTRVTRLDPAWLVCLHPVWTELEALAARLAAITGSDCPQLVAAEEAARCCASAIDAVLAAPDDSHVRAARQADAGFHDALLAAADNPLLHDTLIPIRLTVRRYENACPQPVAPPDTTIDDHARILAAVISSDPERAAVATRAHLLAAHRRLCAGWGLPAPA